MESKVLSSNNHSSLEREKQMNYESDEDYQEANIANDIENNDEEEYDSFSLDWNHPDADATRYDNECDIKTSVKVTKSQHVQELMHYHEKLGHMSFRRIRQMARSGILPTRLSKCDIPLCPSCLYGKLSRKAWRTSKHKNAIAKALKPGQFISVDQLESSTPGLIAQLKGTPTRDRYRIATIFVDHFSDYTFVHLQRDTSSEETLRAKREFERISRSMGVKITHYHSDNGRFIDNAWSNDAMYQGQSVSLCGVKAHHQNGKVERRIRELQDLA